MVRLDDGNIMDKISIAAERFRQMPKQTLELIKNTVAQDATEEELALFLYMASRYGLDPLLREIYFAKIPKRKGGKPEPTYIVSRDGYLKVAMKNPEYQGLNSFVVREGDVFEIDAERGKVIHRFGTKRGKILGAWAIAYRKGYTPCVAFVDFKEYENHRSSAWQKYPSAMIQKVAEVFVLRRQFNISGIYIREELDRSIELQNNENILIQETNGSAKVNKGSKVIDSVDLEPITPTDSLENGSDKEVDAVENEDTSGSNVAEIYERLSSELEADGKAVTKGTVTLLAMQKTKEGELSKDDFERLKKYISDKYK